MIKKYANIAGWLGLALVLLGLIIYSINLVMGVLNWVLLGTGFVLLLAFIILKFNTIKTGLNSRSTKFGTNAAFMIIFVLGIVIVVNILFARFSYRADLTASKFFSLAEQTRKVLENLDKDVKITGFFKTGEEARLQEMLDEYSHFTSKLKYEFVDPDKKPGITKNLNVKSYGTIIFDCAGKQERINNVTEEEITNALITVTRDRIKKIYYSKGHGERDFDNASQTGYTKAKQSILDENYQISELILAINPQNPIPDDCSVLIIADPKTELFDIEKEKITNYLAKGGKAMFLIDSDSPSGYNDFLAKYGFIIGDDIVVDASGIGQLFGAGPTIPIVSKYGEHTISKDFNVMTFFPLARSISENPDKAPDITFTAIAQTSPQSWAETSPIVSDRVSFEEGQDIKGPVTVFAVCEKSVVNPAYAPDNGEIKEFKSRIAVFGDADFASDSYLSVQGNNDLFMNTISWLAEEEDLISVRPKNPEDRRLNLTQKQSRLILYLGVILLPVLIFVTGIVVYVKRK